MKFKTHLVICAILTAWLPVNSALASKGGIEQIGNKFVVGFTYTDNGEPKLCNGALVAMDVIATARHCVLNSNGNYGTNYVFSAPGAKLNATIDAKTVPTEMKNIIIPQQSPVLGIDKRVDVAFIVTNRPFSTGTPIKFATSADFASLNESSKLYGYGYGAVYETGENYSSLPRKFELTWKNSFLVPETNSLYELLNENTSGCLGDSGGPITLTLPDGRELLIGTISGAGEVEEGCGTRLSDNYYHLRITALHPYAKQVPATVTPKITRITCIKGKLSKVVRGVNPKCPKGYKKK